MQKHLYNFIVSIFIADIFLFLSWILISLLWNIPHFISDFYNICLLLFCFFLSRENLFSLFRRSGPLKSTYIFVFSADVWSYFAFSVTQHAVLHLLTLQLVLPRCAAALPSAARGSHGRLPFRARRAAPCPSHLSYIFTLIIQLFISRRLPPSLLFHPRRVHVAIFCFAAAERPQGVRRFLSSAGSGAQPPRIFFCKFLFFSSSFLFFFPLFPLFFFAAPIFCRLPAAINFFPRAAGTMHGEPLTVTAAEINPEPVC